MREYDLTDRAVRDIVAGRAWYDEQGGIELGEQFFDDVLLSIRAVREHPNRYPTVQGEKRATRCRRFPYRVYYEEVGDRIAILAVYHTSRDPDRWDDADRE